MRCKYICAATAAMLSLVIDVYAQTKIEVGFNGKKYIVKQDDRTVNDRLTSKSKRPISFSVEPVNLLIYKVDIKSKGAKLYGDFDDFQPFFDAVGKLKEIDGAKQKLTDSQQPENVRLTGDTEKRDAYLKALDDLAKFVNAADSFRTLLKADGARLLDETGRDKQVADYIARDSLKLLRDGTTFKTSKAMGAEVEALWKAVQSAYQDLGTESSKAEALHLLMARHIDAFIATAKEAGALFKLVNEAEFRVEHDTLSPTNGIMLYTVSIERRMDSPFGNPKELAEVPNKVVEVEVVGGFELDVSGGLYFAKLRDHKYRAVETDGTVSAVRVGPDDDFAFLPGIQLNAYFNSGRADNLGFAFGLSTGDGDRPRYAFGLSYMLRGSSRLILTAGIMLGRVKRLDTSIPPVLGEPVATSDATRQGYFFGLTWNFGK